MVRYSVTCLPADADNGGVCTLSGKLLCDGRNIFLIPSFSFGESRRLGHIAGKLVNVRHRVHQNRLERRDLHDEGRDEIHAVRLSMFTAVRRCDLNGIKRDRHEEYGARSSSVKRWDTKVMAPKN